jgi:hypothetical protein
LLSGKSEEEVFKEKDAQAKAEAESASKVEKKSRERKKDSSDETISGEPPLEAPSYTRALDPEDSGGVPRS